MTIVKIKYEKLFPVGAYLNEKIGFEAEIGFKPLESEVPGHYPVTSEDPLDVIEQLRQLAEQSHREKYPHLYTENGSPTLTQTFPQEEPQKPDTEDMIIEKINKCTSIEGVDGLKTYRLIAQTSDKIKKAYEEKLNQLQQ